MHAVMHLSSSKHRKIGSVWSAFPAFQFAWKPDCDTRHSLLSSPNGISMGLSIPFSTGSLPNGDDKWGTCRKIWQVFQTPKRKEPEWEPSQKAHLNKEPGVAY